MAAVAVVDYNVVLKIGGKTLVGVTNNDFNISPKTKSSITKDDAGVTQESITGREYTFSVSGVMKVDTSTGAATALDSDDIIALAMATGNSASSAFTYERGTGKSLSGNCVITDYSESAPADPESDATYTFSCKVTGTPTLAS